MSDPTNEQKNIQNVELKLERIEASLHVRDVKSDSVNESVKRIEKKMDDFISNTSRDFVTMREFAQHQSAIQILLAARTDGNKSWQGWVQALVPLLVTGLIAVYAILGGGH